LIRLSRIIPVLILGLVAMFFFAAIIGVHNPSNGRRGEEWGDTGQK
jgi:hypothetical protein